jgi:hypothetical protein
MQKPEAIYRTVGYICTQPPPTSFSCCITHSFLF